MSIRRGKLLNVRENKGALMLLRSFVVMGNVDTEESTDTGKGDPS